MNQAQRSYLSAHLGCMETRDKFCYLTRWGIDGLPSTFTSCFIVFWETVESAGIYCLIKLVFFHACVRETHNKMPAVYVFNLNKLISHFNEEIFLPLNSSKEGALGELGEKFFVTKLPINDQLGAPGWLGPWSCWLKPHAGYRDC